MPNGVEGEDSLIRRSWTLGKYYAWRGGSGRRHDYSRRIVGFKSGASAELEYFAGKVARAIQDESVLNRRSNILVPVPSSRRHNPARPHRGELLCQVVTAMPGVLVRYGPYVARIETIRSSHGTSVASRPDIEEHMETLEVRIPHPTRGYATRLGSNQRGSLNAILFDDVRYFGATSEACARLLVRAGFSTVYAIYLGQNQP